MTWKKNIYESLTGCATLCDEFAANCSKNERIEEWYRSIFLSLDCADMCRQLTMLYVRGSENTCLLAKACIEVCEKCATEVKQFDNEACSQVYAACQQTICNCINLLDMNTKENIMAQNAAVMPSSLFYGVDLRETLYN